MRRVAVAEPVIEIETVLDSRRQTIRALKELSVGVFGSSKGDDGTGRGKQGRDALIIRRVRSAGEDVIGGTVLVKRPSRGLAQ